jgi:hypothetical protein
MRSKKYAIVGNYPINPYRFKGVLQEALVLKESTDYGVTVTIASFPRNADHIRD